MSGEKHWFYQHGGHWFGPVSTKDLKQLAADGEIAPMDPAWKQGLGSRIRLGQIKDLFTFSARNAALKPESVGVAAKDRGPARTYRGPGVPLALRDKLAKTRTKGPQLPPVLPDGELPEARHNPFL